MSKLSEKYGKKVSKKEERAIQKAMDEQKANKGRFRDVPEGEYPVIVDKLEIGETSWGDEQITIWFKITDGEFKNSNIFYNGMFNDNFSNGINATAMLLSDMLDDEDLTSAQIAVMLSKYDEDMDAVKDFIADVAEEVESLAYDLNYEISTSKKTNPNTGKPYINKSYEIIEVYDR